MNMNSAQCPPLPLGPPLALLQTESSIIDLPFHQSPTVSEHSFFFCFAKLKHGSFSTPVFPSSPAQGFDLEKGTFFFVLGSKLELFLYFFTILHFFLSCFSDRIAYWRCVERDGSQRHDDGDHWVILRRDRLRSFFLSPSNCKKILSTMGYRGQTLFVLFQEQV